LNQLECMVQNKSISSQPNHHAQSVLMPENLRLIADVAQAGSMAQAARQWGMVLSALTYRIRQIEDALDVLLFDRRSRQASITPAGQELLRSAQHVLQELDAVAQRVKRVATGWEPQLTIAADSLISRATLLDLCERFYELKAPTRLKIRTETLTGTLETVLTGKADLALGISLQNAQAGQTLSGLQTDVLGEVPFVFAIAPHHPLAALVVPLSDSDIQPHRAVAVADTTQKGQGVSIGLLAMQEVLTVPSMEHKLEAQLRGLGCGFLPQPLAQAYIDQGRLLVKQVQRGRQTAQVGYAWRALAGPSASKTDAADLGKALQWWLRQLEMTTCRHALLHRHA
jgi:DNA-binding transcriptional LysR family regulator